MKPFSFSAALLTLLLLPTLNRADEVPLQSFERNPMLPNQMQIGPFPGAVSYPDWRVVKPASAPAGAVSLSELDSHYGVQSLLLNRGAVGTQSSLELFGHLPLAEIAPGFVDFWLRPTCWSGTTGGAGNFSPYAEGPQVFVDGHFFSFFRSNSPSNPLKLFYSTHESFEPWTTNFQSSVVVPVLETSYWSEDVTARDWVRFTARVDPVTQSADVWLNGRLVLTGVPRSPAYFGPSFPAPSFYVRSSSNGPLGFDDFQLTSSNPLFPDMDADGLPDSWELANGLDISVNDRQLDKDGDGLLNLAEYIHGTGGNDADSDDDGMEDGWEVEESFAPLFDRDAWQDSDRDGVSNRQEFALGSDPHDEFVSPPNNTMYVMGSEWYYPPWWTENGNYDTPFSTLQAAVDALPGGGTVVVLPDYYGTLMGPGNHDVVINHKITIKGNGVWIYGCDENWSPAYPGFIIAGTGPPELAMPVTIEGFNFYGFRGWQGSAVYVDGHDYPGTSLTLRDCEFQWCEALDNGGALRFNDVTSAFVENCVFSGVWAGGKGGALSARSFI